MDGQQVKNSNLAFEDGFDGSPPELWRLEAKRKAASRSKAARRSGSPLTRRQIESVERQH